jgi:hypothetical protein
MSLRLQVPPVIRAADRAFRAAEATTALIFRSRPLNHGAEQARLLRSWSAGLQTEPVFVYAARPNLSPLRSNLTTIARELSQHGPLGALYAERAQELELEAQLAEAVGHGEFRRLARQRFAPNAVSLSEAEEVARAWLTLAPGDSGARVVSDDRTRKESLYCQLARWVGKTALPFRIEVSDEIVSIAATGEGVFLVAGGRSLSVNDGVRIAIHEVFGHGLPGHRARFQVLGLFAAASARGIDEQEGYAVLCEERAGVLDADRKRDLAARHVAALSVFDGATWTETCRLLSGQGVDVAHAVRTASRVHRGGGLGREVTYLPAWCRVRTALAAEPALESWLAAGRVSLAAAEVLRGLVQIQVPSHGAWGTRTTEALRAELAAE